MTKEGKIFLTFFLILATLNIQAQRKKDRRDYSLKDSIPVSFTDPEPEKLNIKSTLRISNDYIGNYDLGRWNDFRNLTMVEYGFEIKKLPILLNFGREQGSIYNDNYGHFIYNFKVDLMGYLENLKNRVDLSKPLDQLDPKLAEDILKEEVNKKVNQELQKGYSKTKLDSLQTKMESMKNYEAKMNNPAEIEKIKQRKVLLKEFAAGNKIDGLNYDSLSNLQKDFDVESMDYQANQKNPELNQYRKTYQDVMSNKDKALDIKNKTEGRIESLRNNFKLLDRLSLSRLKIHKFNFGQTSLDNSELVFRSFMVNGLSLELKSPLFLQFVYSVPFQTNLFSNFQVNNIQTQQVYTLGGAIGTNKDKPLNAQIGYYQFKEKNGNADFRGANPELTNRLFLITTQWKTKKLNTKLEIAKSETSKFQNQKLFSFQNWQESSAIKLSNELELSKTNTSVNLELQHIGLGYYTSGNPFIRRGTGGLISLNQKLGTKLQFKSKASYRYSEDSNRYNSNLTTTAQLKYKLNRNTSFEARGSFFQSQIEFGVYETNIKNELYTLQWNQRIKSKKIQHNIVNSLQYSKTESQGSAELNNSGLSRNGILISNYAMTASKLNLNANVENNFNIDSNMYSLGNGVNLAYIFTPKFQLGGGLNSRISREGFLQKGIQLNFSWEIGKIIVLGNLNYIEDKLLKNKLLSPQLRLSYQVF